MSRPLLRRRAVRDIEDIWSYTADRWGTAQAERYIRAIRDACAGLASGRQAGTDARDVIPGYRKVQAGRHVIYFRRGPDGSVDVVRILHERMDAPTRLAE